MRAFWTASLYFALLSCSTPTLRTSHDQDPKANFSNLKTWAWLPTSMAPQLNGHAPEANGRRTAVHSELNRARVRSAIENELARKGFKMAWDAPPDFYVAPRLLTGERIEAEDVHSSYGWTQDLKVYDEGALIIDVIRPSDDRLIWRGAGADVLDPKRTTEEREKKIGEAVKAILEPFPPKK
jgi:hypothetical protein